MRRAYVETSVPVRVAPVGAGVAWLRRQGQSDRQIAQEVAEEIEGTLAVLPAGAPHRQQDGLSFSTRGGAVAAPHLAVDHREPQGMLGPPVGGIYAGNGQEREQFMEMLPEMSGQPFVGRLTLGWPEQSGQPPGQMAAGQRQAVPADLAGRVAIAQRQCRSQRLRHLVREMGRPTRRYFQQLRTSPPQVLQALLMPRLLELVIRRPTIM